MGFILLGILNSQAAGAGAVAVAGYVAGGDTSGGKVSTVDKFAFPDETRTTLATGLSNNVDYQAGFSDAGVAGYSAGGRVISGTAYTDVVDKFAFPSDSRSTLATGLPQNTAFFKGMSNPEVAGYTLGGYRLAPGASLDEVYKFAFPSDSRSTLSTGLSGARYGAAGFSDAGVAGYSAGGIFDPTAVSTVDKFAFPDETRTTLATGLSSARNYLAGMSNDSVAGYVGGGSGNQSIVDKFAFPSDTRTTLATGLSVGTASPAAGYDNDGVAGYFAGSDTTANIDRFAFPSDTRTIAAAGLSSLREYGAGFQDA